MTTTDHGGATLDPTEVERFGRLAARWWDPDGEFRPLHLLAPARLAFVRAQVLRHFARPDEGFRPFKGLSFLDVGCGGGLVSEPLARLGAEVTAIDPSPDTIAAARSHAVAQSLAIGYEAARIEDLVVAKRQFDVLVCLEVLEHVPDPALFVRSLSQVVRPGGVVIVSTINRTAAAYAVAIVGAERIARWLPVGTHQWDRFIAPDELTRYFADAGLVPGEPQGLTYDVLSDRWRLGAGIEINYLMAATRPT